MPTMSDRKCSRCKSPLALSNKNEDGLCSRCQNDLAPHHPDNKKYKEWIEAGKPTISRPRKLGPLSIRTSKRLKLTGRHMPDPSTVPTSYLIACFKELSRRTKEADQLIAVRKMMRLPRDK